MSEDTQAAPQASTTQASSPQNQIDPAFFTSVNEYLELANRQANQQGPKRTSMSSLYAAARFNAHVYLINAKAAAGERTAFLDYMGDLYRRMLNEHLDGLGAERGIDVGKSELAQPADGTVPGMDVAPAGGEAG